MPFSGLSGWSSVPFLGSEAGTGAGFACSGEASVAGTGACLGTVSRYVIGFWPRTYGSWIVSHPLATSTLSARRMVVLSLPTFRSSVATLGKEFRPSFTLAQDATTMPVATTVVGTPASRKARSHSA